MRIGAFRFCIFIFLFITSLTCAHGQQLVLYLLNGEVEAIVLSDLRSIKFDSNLLLIYQKNGNVISWNMADINSYQFDLATAATSKDNQDTMGALRIYPNPASDIVEIEYTGAKNRNILIEILDGNGRRIEELYQGVHMAKTLLRWDAGVKRIAPGIYYCRVISNTKTVTGRIFIR